MSTCHLRTNMWMRERRTLESGYPAGDNPNAITTRDKRTTNSLPSTIHIQSSDLTSRLHNLQRAQLTKNPRDSADPLGQIILTRTSRPSLTLCRTTERPGSHLPFPLPDYAAALGTGSHSDLREVPNRRHSVINRAHLWTRWRFHRAGLFLFLTSTFTVLPINLSTPGRQIQSECLCTATPLPRQTSARRHLAAPSSPQGRTIPPQSSSCLPSATLSTKL